MGIETALFVLAVGAKTGESYEESQAASEKSRALDIQGKEIRLSTEQKTLANYDAMEKVLQAQIAHMTTTGLAFSSPSFNAIQRATYNTAAKSAKNIELMGDIQEENTRIEKENVENTLYAQLFGNVASTAVAGTSLYTKMPTGGSV
jgi:translation elongation factor P/translation initiation factor 5A